MLLNNDLQSRTFIVIKKFLSLIYLTEIVAPWKPFVSFHSRVAIEIKIFCQARFCCNLCISLEMIEHLAWLKISIITLLILEFKLYVENCGRILAFSFLPILLSFFYCSFEMRLMSINQTKKFILTFNKIIIIISLIVTSL